MKLIIGMDIDSAIKSPNFVILEQSQFIYIFGISCVIPKVNMTINDVFILIKKGGFILNYNFEYDVSIDEKDQVFIIKKEYYNEFVSPSFNVEVINSLLFRTIFESIMRVKNPMYMLAFLVNYIGSDGYVSNKNNALEKIKIVIMENINNCDFNLKKLCDLVYMSRRKVQYILSSYNESFLSLLHDFRIDNLKMLINENPKAFISELIHLGGFRSYQTANRLFKKHVGVSIKQYKQSKLYLLESIESSLDINQLVNLQ
jgi:AraC-like DNA-binding protein